MHVSVKPYLFLREALGSDNLVVALARGETIFDLLQFLRSEKGLPNKIESRHGNLIIFEGNMPVGLTILVDGRNIKQLQGTATILNEGAVISLFPPAAGG